MNEKLTSGLFSRKAFLTVYLFGLTVPLLFYLAENAGSIYADIFRDSFREGLLDLTIAAAVGVFMTAPQRPRKLALTTWLLIGSFGWLVLRFLIERDLLFYFTPGMLWRRGIVAWFLFYPFCSMVDEKELKAGVLTLTAVWSGAYTLLSLLGIYAAATNTIFYSINDYSAIGIMPYEQTHRLWLMKYATITAENLLIAISMALITLFLCRKKWAKILSGVSCGIMYIALGLTDGRTGMIALGTLLGACVFVYVIGRFKDNRKVGISVGIAAALLTLVLSYSVDSQLQGFFSHTITREIRYNEVFNRPYPSDFGTNPLDETPVPVQEGNAEGSLAFHPVSQVSPLRMTSGGLSNDKLGAAILDDTPEDVNTDQMSHRGIEFTLTGRTDLWRASLEALSQNDDNILLLGKTPYLFRDVLECHGYPQDMAHCHNIYLQVILEWGIPGLLLMVPILVLFAMAALRLMFAFDLPFWKRFISGPAIALLCADLADCFTMLYSTSIAIYILFFFIGLTIDLDRKHRNA